MNSNSDSAGFPMIVEVSAANSLRSLKRLSEEVRTKRRMIGKPKTLGERHLKECCFLFEIQREILVTNRWLLRLPTRQSN